MKASGADEAAVREVLESAERQCPASDCIKNPVPVICTAVDVT